ncbi:alpha/beta hydrolase [Streptomyces sp. NBC_00259]|uniref:alpha/beta hydrolase n=1 Tax=Streptomyces sp. NBC_00259 TaxID=2903643 RepID=UPI002E2DF0B5|nr:alpha/beta fold hydrolase [Streptomyces sp. NBC_00259]
MSDRTILLIHGLWMTPHSWQPWIDRYTAQGHTVHAPGWPGVSQLGEPLDHAKAPAGLGVQEIADHYEAFLRTLPEQPVIIGHSFGGLVTQILLDRGYGRAGVAIHPGQPRGVLALSLSTLRAAWPVLGNPANRRRTVALTDRQFHYAFANTVSAEQAARERATWAIPGPGRPLFQAGLANFTPKARAATRIDYRNDSRSPLLLVAGGADHIVPRGVVRENYRRYAKSGAVTEFREYPGRDHGTCFHDGWEQVADESLAWALAY